MQVRRKAQRNAWKEILANRCCSIGKLDREVRTLENSAVLPQKPLHHPVKERCGDRESRLEKILNSLLNLAGQDGWDHLTCFHYLTAYLSVANLSKKRPSLHVFLYYHEKRNKKDMFSDSVQSINDLANLTKIV